MPLTLPFAGIAVKAAGFLSYLSNLRTNGRTERLLLNWRLLRGFPLAVIQVEEQARYLGALDQGASRHSSEEATAEHAGQRLDWQTWVAGAVDSAAGMKSIRPVLAG